MCCCEFAGNTTARGFIGIVVHLFFTLEIVHALQWAPSRKLTMNHSFHWNPSGRTESPQKPYTINTPTPKKNNSDVISGSIPIWTKKHCWLLRASSPPAASKTPDLPAMWEMWGGCNPEFKGHRSWKVCWVELYPLYQYYCTVST